MRRDLRPDELQVWARVAATVRPSPGHAVPDADAPPPQPPPLKPPSAPRRRSAPTIRHRPSGRIEAIEPNRHERLVRGRDRIARRLDLHGMGQDDARAALFEFVEDAFVDGCRAVLVITGKGLRGDGVLRRRTPEWLAEPGLRQLVGGVSEAHRRHGGEGALYVALKRRPADSSSPTCAVAGSRPRR